MVGHPVKCTGAGRTDAGVHAETYIANFRTSSCIPCDRIPLAVNTRLPDDIVVIKATEVPDGFNAIGSCLKKEYTYRIYNSHIRNAFFVNRAWFYPKHLDETDAACGLPLCGYPRLRGCSASAPKPAPPCARFTTLISPAARAIECRVCADGFLYNMVRAMVGTCVYRRRQFLPMTCPPFWKAATAPPPGLLYRRGAL